MNFFEDFRFFTFVDVWLIFTDIRSFKKAFHRRFQTTLLQQEEKSLSKDAIHKKMVESQAPGYAWWKEVEVELPTHFLKRRKERMLAEKVGWSLGNGQNKEEESL